jgi:hypothetical protein
MYFSPTAGIIPVYSPKLAANIPGQTKKGLGESREEYVLNTLSPTIIFPTATYASDLTDATIEAIFVCPARVKIPKINVAFTAIDSLAGTNLFNIVVGTGTPSGLVPGNDNSSTSGFCTNTAPAGTQLFNVDVPFTVVVFPGATTGAGGSAGLGLIPTYPDAVYASGTILTLRLTTTASTGAITNLNITALLEVQPLSSTFPSEQTSPAPNVPFGGISF